MSAEEEWKALSEAEKAQARKLAILYQAEKALGAREEEAAKAGAAEEIRKACGARKKLKKAIDVEIAKCAKTAKAGKMKCPAPSKD